MSRLQTTSCPFISIILATKTKAPQIQTHSGCWSLINAQGQMPRRAQPEIRQMSGASETQCHCFSCMLAAGFQTVTFAVGDSSFNASLSSSRRQQSRGLSVHSRTPAWIKWLNAVSGKALMIFGLDCRNSKEPLIETDCEITASLCINSG